MSSEKQRNNWLTKEVMQNTAESRRMSKAYMKQIILVIVSSIIEKRIVFLDDNFITRQFRGVPYKVLKSRITDPELQYLQTSIKGITDLFEKECLNNAYLLICNKQDSDEIYECYTLNFDYKEIENIEDRKGALKEKITEQTIGLLSSINGLNSQNSFQHEQVLLTIILTYYDSDIPELENFQYVVDQKPILKLLEAREESMKSLYSSELKTRFYTLKCSADHQPEEFMNSIAQSKSDLHITIDEVTQNDETFLTNESNEKIIDSAPEIEMTKEDKQQTKTPKTNINYDLTKANPEQFKCSCGIQWRIPVIKAVQCKKCLTFHHCICVGQLKADKLPNPFECYECNNTSLSINFKKFNIMCLMIVYMYFANTFPNDLYYKLSEIMKKDMIKKLKTKKVIQEATNGYTIDIQRLEAELEMIEARFGTSNIIILTPDSMELK